MHKQEGQGSRHNKAICQNYCAQTACSSIINADAVCTGSKEKVFGMQEEVFCIRKPKSQKQTSQKGPKAKYGFKFLRKNVP